MQGVDRNQLIVIKDLGYEGAHCTHSQTLTQAPLGGATVSHHSAGKKKDGWSGGKSDRQSANDVEKDTKRARRGKNTVNLNVVHSYF